MEPANKSPLCQVRAGEPGAQALTPLLYSVKWQGGGGSGLQARDRSPFCASKSMVTRPLRINTAVWLSI